MNNTEPKTTDFKSATYTHTAIVVRPSINLTAAARAEMAEDLLEQCYRYTRATRKAVIHENIGLQDLCSGRAPRTIWSRCYLNLNECRLPGAPMREPSLEHIDQFKARFGGLVYEASLVMLIELPTAGAAFDKLLRELRELPTRAVVNCDVSIGKNRNALNPFSIP